MNIYEMFGRMAEEKQGDFEFMKGTMELLRQLKSGAVTLDQLELSEKGWNVNPTPLSNPSN